ncbi:efflux RND transporter periplasmic adaptor subunit [Pseudacidobacterium ailaaui]|uniref:efflux RND transporter periplasmic adaptor subunit n=1 Tax=Pseudacidobacterium ailaaui TaxID=1382359 RepID=UPI0005D197E0|nr:efflux RND transporter periplasmic adaptor subunit [Pseudacidobacterium ailaaui]
MSNTSQEQQARPLSRGKAGILLFVFLAVAVGIAIAGILPRLRDRKELRQQTSELAAPTVLVAAPQLGAPSEEVVLPGNIFAYVDSPIYARTSGYLRKWYFDIGAHVRKGQLLAEIESPEVDQQLAQARADLLTAEANAKYAQMTASRYQDLVKSNAVSRQDTENFTTQAAATNTQVKSALANVQRLEQLVSFEKIYAPFDGVVTARGVDIGQLIDAGANKELFHLSDEHILRVYVNVPQLYSLACKPGVTADLTFVEYPGRTFQGRIVRTAKAIDPTSRTLLVEVDVDNRSGDLVPGAYAQVHFKLQSPVRSLIVPVPALLFRSEGLRVAIVQDNKARLVPITIGRDDGRVVEVTAGLHPEDQVIQDPPDSIVDGEPVRIVQPGQQQKSGGE